MKTKKSFFGLFGRGLAMGAADVVPGVSGGTIAFITGIYEELLATIGGVRFSLLKVWKNEGFKAFWQKSNFTFLISLLSGIAVSIITLSKLISWLLVEHTILVWSFFFGLVIASIWLVGKTIPKWNAQNIIGLIAGAAFAYWVTIITPTSGSENLLYIFISGAIAICAMILPGISGSFILVLMGSYMTVLGSITGAMSALKVGDWDLLFGYVSIIVVFMAGCLVGILSFSRLLSWLFAKAHDLTIAILTGFLIGSLNKIWPWKKVEEYFVKHPGEPNEELVPLIEKNVLPSTYTELTSQPNHLIFAVFLALVGFLVIYILERAGSKKKMVDSVK
jgi:putative membrane protein